VAEFKNERLRGSRFEHVDLTDAQFRLVNLNNVQVREADMTGFRVRGAMLIDVDIYGELRNVRVNGVDVVPLVEAELNRRYPERAKMAATTPAEFREAWDVLERLWQQTVSRAQGMAAELLYVSVDDEWSFVQTLRHLVFATDAWVKRVVLGEPAPWHPLGLPHDEMPDIPGEPRGIETRPSLDDVLAARDDRMATVRDVIDQLTDAQLSSMTEPVMEPGYPESESFPVRECLRVILNEEWEHRLYAERDLDALAAGEY
jgi:uncharacterized protein YjbI with pentapeptide repeats